MTGSRWTYPNDAPEATPEIKTLIQLDTANAAIRAAHKAITSGSPDKAKEILERYLDRHDPPAVL